MTKREAHIIKRLKHVAKMSIMTIARVTQRRKKTIYNVVQGKAKFGKRGPKDKLTQKEITNLVKILRSMISKAKDRHEITLLPFADSRAGPSLCHRFVMIASIVSFTMLARLWILLPPWSFA